MTRASKSQLGFPKAGLTCLLVVLVGAAFPAPAFANGLIPDLTESQIAEAKKILAGFKTDPRGPFHRIRWFCNDGTVHPPSPPPCADRGGGRQHATVSPEAEKLAQWNIHVGTILAGISYEELVDAEHDHYRLKELVLEDYLEQVDGGWIYRRAYSYRGARQIEDEEKAGRRLLVRLFADPEWLKNRYYLANKLVEVVPHGARTGLVRKIRALAKSAAEQDPQFQAIRTKIHSFPGDEDLAAVKQFLAQKDPAEPAKSTLQELAGLLEKQQSEKRVAAQAEVIQKRLDGTALERYANAFANAIKKGEQTEVFSTGAGLSFQIFQSVTDSKDGLHNLELLDINAVVQEAGFRAANALAPSTRRARLERLQDFFHYLVGAGLLSPRQLEFLKREERSLLASETAEPKPYHSSIHYLARSAEWCRATANREFWPVIEHYQRVEPLASSLLDHLLRSSVALALSQQLEELIEDANQIIGLKHFVLGTTSSARVLGMNPGVAIGRLSILEPGSDLEANFDPRRIYVIPQTVSELRPMAGVLTLDSGNALSHTQLLAANLGIPNAAISSSFLPYLEQWEGKELFFAVTPQGGVVVRDKKDLAEETLALWNREVARGAARVELETSRLDLATRKLLNLQTLDKQDSGVRVGPKAANLGELANRFPTMVAPGFAIPFGVYAEHIQRPVDTSGRSIETEIEEAFQEAEKLREAGAGAEEIRDLIFPRLAEIRKWIETISFLPEFEEQLIRRIQKDFGESDSPVGVFIRSDTNAEDLPGFTGAGLNLTVPNQVGLPKILQAVKDVWASPFTERAYEWRSRAFSGSHRVYPSVIVMRSVPSDKSGVIASMNLETGDRDEITVNTSEGVGGVVEGGVAESLLLKPNGEVKLLHQARPMYRKVLAESGGLKTLPPIGKDKLLTDGEIEQIRRLVGEIEQKYPPARTDEGEPLPWDIEFGIVNGQLRLFQIRPLVRYREIKTLEALSRLGEESPQTGPVRLDEPI